MSRQARLELSDRAELLQSEAAVAARKMQSQQALDEEASAARAFNTVRGIESNEVPERLSVINDELIRSLSLPKREQARADVRAAEQQARAAKASSLSSGESSKPAVDLFLNAGLNGRDPASGTAISESLSTNHPNYAVGVKVNIPLQQGIAARAREGYQIQAESSDLAFRRKAYETEREWTDLNQRLEESRKRLDLARKLEDAQKAKLDAERNRLRRGRTTTYTVIQFEEDFANAQLNRLRIEAEILGIYSQLKTFGGSK
jgi:outer membrane protein TolC